MGALLQRRCLRSIYNPVELGTNTENGNSHVWLQSVLWFLEFVPGGERKAFLGHFSVTAITLPSRARLAQRVPLVT
jgi:hypothetical protein